MPPRTSNPPPALFSPSSSSRSQRSAAQSASDKWKPLLPNQRPATTTKQPSLQQRQVAGIQGLQQSVTLLQQQHQQAMDTITSLQQQQMEHAAERKRQEEAAAAVVEKAKEEEKKKKKVKPAQWAAEDKLNLAKVCNQMRKKLPCKKGAPQDQRDAYVKMTEALNKLYKEDGEGPDKYTLAQVQNKYRNMLSEWKVLRDSEMRSGVDGTVREVTDEWFIEFTSAQYEGGARPELDTEEDGLAPEITELYKNVRSTGVTSQLQALSVSHQPTTSSLSLALSEVPPSDGNAIQSSSSPINILDQPDDLAQPKDSEILISEEEKEEGDITEIQSDEDDKEEQQQQPVPRGGKKRSMQKGDQLIKEAKKPKLGSTAALAEVWSLRQEQRDREKAEDKHRRDMEKADKQHQRDREKAEERRERQQSLQAYMAMVQAIIAPQHQYPLPPPPSSYAPFQNL